MPSCYREREFLDDTCLLCTACLVGMLLLNIPTGRVLFFSSATSRRSYPRILWLDSPCSFSPGMQCRICVERSLPPVRFPRPYSGFSTLVQHNPSSKHGLIHHHNASRYISPPRRPIPRANIGPATSSDIRAEHGSRSASSGSQLTTRCTPTRIAFAHIRIDSSSAALHGSKLRCISH